MSKQLFDIDTFRAQPLPSEEEVMANWQGDIDKPVVSVLCMTFNQATYIEDAFRGFLIQKTDFVFEVIVHDDASTDGTSDIVKEYAKRYPQIFKPVIQTENQYSQGKKPTLLSSAHAKGMYYALCEGDDFWIDENKLQLQYEALEEAKNIDLSIHCSLKHNCHTGEVVVFTKYSNKTQVIPTQAIIEYKAGQIATNSMFMRRSVVEKFRCFYNDNIQLTVGDIYLQFFGSLNGGVHYIDKLMSIYNVYSLGSWTEKNKDSKKLYHHLCVKIDSYKELNKITECKYSSSILRIINKTLKINFLNESFKVEFKFKLFLKYRNYISVFKWFIYIPLVSLPFLLKSLFFIKRKLVKLW